MLLRLSKKTERSTLGLLWTAGLLLRPRADYSLLIRTDPSLSLLSLVQDEARLPWQVGIATVAGCLLAIRLREGWLNHRLDLHAHHDLNRALDVLDEVRVFEARGQQFGLLLDLATGAVR